MTQIPDIPTDPPAEEPTAPPTFEPEHRPALATAVLALLLLFTAGTSAYLNLVGTETVLPIGAAPLLAGLGAFMVVVGVLVGLGARLSRRPRGERQ